MNSAVESRWYHLTPNSTHHFRPHPTLPRLMWVVQRRSDGSYRWMILQWGESGTLASGHAAPDDFATWQEAALDCERAYQERNA